MLQLLLRVFYSDILKGPKSFRFRTHIIFIILRMFLTMVDLLNKDYVRHSSWSLSVLELHDASGDITAYIFRSEREEIILLGWARYMF
jgi:hypothetical protein